MDSFSSINALRTAWDAEALDPGRINSELSALWQHVAGAGPTVPIPGHEAPASQVGGFLRANTLNLIAFAEDAQIADMITGTIAQLRDFLPSRTIIFIMDPERTRQDLWHVEVQLLEGDNTHKETMVLFETITITTNPSMSEHLKSVVSALVVSELPNFLWWPSGSFMSNKVFLDLVVLADRLIVDTARLGLDTNAFIQMRKLLTVENTFSITDITWGRIQPWRQLIAQFFDPVESRPYLNSISQITIDFAAERADRGSGFAATLLIIGWLASRLGWEMIEPMEPRHSGGWTVPLRARDARGKARFVQARINPNTDDHPTYPLRQVELVATGEYMGTFRVNRNEQDDLVTTSTVGGGPAVSRLVYSQRKPIVYLLGEELQRFGGEPSYEAALKFAIGLLPK